MRNFFSLQVKNQKLVFEYNLNPWVKINQKLYNLFQKKDSSFQNIVHNAPEGCNNHGDIWARTIRWRSITRCRTCFSFCIFTTLSADLNKNYPINRETPLATDISTAILLSRNKSTVYLSAIFSLKSVSN